MTLEEEVAGEIAQLLIEAAKARQSAATEEQNLTKLLSEASELESEGIKWERRLSWWKHLRDKNKRSAMRSSNR